MFRLYKILNEPSYIDIIIHIQHPDSKIENKATNIWSPSQFQAYTGVGN